MFTHPPSKDKPEDAQKLAVQAKATFRQKLTQSHPKLIVVDELLGALK